MAPRAKGIAAGVFGRAAPWTGEVRVAAGVFAAVLLCLVPAARAQEIAGVTMPDRIEVEGRTLVLNGVGARRVLLLRAYVVGLYLEKPTRDAGEALRTDQPRQVRVQQILPGERGFVARLIRGDFVRNSGGRMALFEDRLSRLLAMFPTVRRGDVTTMTWHPARQGTEVVIAGRARGWLEGKDFADALLGTFIGEHPISDELKSSMMGW